MKGNAAVTVSFRRRRNSLLVEQVSETMAEPYLADLTRLIESNSGLTDDVVCKHFFSGAAAYVDGKVFATLTPVGIAFKLPQTRCETLLSEDGMPLRYFPAAPVKRDYVLFVEPGALGADRLATLLAESVSHAIGR